MKITPANILRENYTSVLVFPLILKLKILSYKQEPRIIIYPWKEQTWIHIPPNNFYRVMSWNKMKIKDSL